jgi:hypothetical protein
VTEAEDSTVTETGSSADQMGLQTAVGPVWDGEWWWWWWQSDMSAKEVVGCSADQMGFQTAVGPMWDGERW